LYSGKLCFREHNYLTVPPATSLNSPPHLGQDALPMGCSQPTTAQGEDHSTNPPLWFKRLFRCVTDLSIPRGLTETFFAQQFKAAPILQLSLSFSFGVRPMLQPEVHLSFTKITCTSNPTFYYQRNLFNTI
jgi:hypothetical protein